MGTNYRESGDAIRAEKDGSGNWILWNETDDSTTNPLLKIDEDTGEVTWMNPPYKGIDSYNTSTNLTEVGSIQDSTNIDGPHDVEIFQGYAYVAGKDGSFAIVDVSDPSNPTLEGSITSGMTNPEVVIPWSANIAFVAANDFHVINTSDTSSPKIATTLTINDKINGYDTWGNYIFLASKDGYIEVVDVSDPFSPVLQASQSAVQSTHDIAVSRDHVLLVNQTNGGNHQVQSWNVINSSENTIAPTSNWNEDSYITDTTNMNGANRIIVAGNYAYVAANESHTLSIIDISNLSNISRVSTISTQGATDGIAYGDNSIYASSGKYLEIYDVSDPSSPSRSNYLQLSSNTESLHDLELYGDHVVVTSQFDDTLHMVQIGRFIGEGIAVGGLRTGNLHSNGLAYLRNLRVANNLSVAGHSIIPQKTLTQMGLSSDDTTTDYASGWDQVPLDSIGQDVLGEADTSNHEIVVKNSGTYQVSGQVLFLSVDVDSRILVKVARNDTDSVIIGDKTVSYNTDTSTNCGPLEVKADPNDKFQLYARIIDGTDKSISGGQIHWTNLEVKRMR